MVVRGVILILVVLLLMLQYRLWLGEGGLVRLWELRQAVQAQQVENRSLLQRNQSLAAEVRDLKHGLDAVEDRARTDLGMIREGETFVQIVIPQPLSGGTSP